MTDYERMSTYEKLAYRAVESGHWRALRGMAWIEWYGEWGRKYEGPDLTDAATRGCLLQLVREAWEDPHASVWYDSEYWHSGNGWSWHAKEQSRVDYDTEAEALVAALEAAP